MAAVDVVRVERAGGDPDAHLARARLGHLEIHDLGLSETLAEIELPGATGGLPMTYMIDGKQYIVVAVAGSGQSELVALTLPN